MKKTSLALLVSAIFALSACSPEKATAKNEEAPAPVKSTQTLDVPALSGDAADAFVTVGDVVYTNADVKALLEVIGGARANEALSSPDAMNELREQIISQEILAQEAKRLGINESQQYIVQANFAAKGILAASLFKDYVAKNPATDEELTKEYETLKSRHDSTQVAQADAGMEYKAKHILLASEEEAKELIKKINGGEDFAKLAKEHSKDPVSGAEGGQLDWSPAGIYVPEFAQALTELKKGEMTKEPVQTQFGWHIIIVDDTREVEAPPAVEFPPLDENIKTQLRKQIEFEKFMKYQQELLEKAEVK